MICEEKINVKYSEMDYNLALKPYTLLNYLQDIASKSAEDLGFGYSYISKKNLAWFLLKYRMEFSDYPIEQYELILKTEPRGYNKLFAYRDFELLANNKTIGKISSIWSLVDINTKAILPVANALENNPKMPAYQKREGDLVFSKIKLENPTTEKEFEVRYNDLDVNQHANNGNYIIWAFEPLDFNFKSTHKLKTLDLIYKKEAKFGEKIISQIEFKDTNTTVHRLKNIQEEDLCLLECTWGKIN